MSAIRTRSSSVPLPVPRQLPGSIIATRSRGNSRIISPALRQNNLAFLANNGQAIAPATPEVVDSPSIVLSESILEAPAPADVPNESANTNQSEAAEENVERDSADLPIPINLEPALPSAKDKPSRMYSDEDIKAIIKAAMQEFTESTRIASKQSTHENHLEFTGSEITSEAMDNLLDIQSIIEIDINDTPDMVILESRRVPVKEIGRASCRERV